MCREEEEISPVFVFNGLRPLVLAQKDIPKSEDFWITQKFFHNPDIGDSKVLNEFYLEEINRDFVGDNN